jgi:hypothetical protein
MLLLLLLACECETHLDNTSFPHDRFDHAGTWHVCAANDMPTRVTLRCHDDAPRVFIGEGMDETVLDVASSGAAGTDRAFEISGCTVELRDLTVTGARVEEPAECADGDGTCSGMVGGAFALRSANVTLTRVRVTGNFADEAGAGDVNDSALLLVDSEVSANVHGGFAVRGDATLTSEGTSWSGNDDRDVVLEGDDFAAGASRDFTCDAAGCG